MNRIVVAKELVKLAKELVAFPFDGITFKVLPNVTTGDVNAGFYVMVEAKFDGKAVMNISKEFGKKRHFDEMSRWEFDPNEKFVVRLLVRPMDGDVDMPGKTMERPEDWFTDTERFAIKLLLPMLRKNLRKIQRDSGYVDYEARAISESQ